MAAVRRGRGREAAHEAIKEHAVAVALELRESGRADNDLFDRLAADPRLGLTADELRAVDRRAAGADRHRRRPGRRRRRRGREDRRRPSRRPPPTGPAGCSNATSLEILLPARDASRAAGSTSSDDGVEGGRGTGSAHQSGTCLGELRQLGRHRRRLPGVHRAGHLLLDAVRHGRDDHPAAPIGISSKVSVPYMASTGTSIARSASRTASSAVAQASDWASARVLTTPAAIIGHSGEASAPASHSGGMSFM